MTEDAKLEPIQSLLGTWTGSGHGPQGPFDVRAEFEERGRWILLRHQISPPGSVEPFYYSTQVFGYDEEGLTLDYFDTAGTFHFTGARDQDGLSFSWKNHDTLGDDVWKESVYSDTEARTMEFSYRSCERQDGNETQVVEFTGHLTKA